MDYAKIIPFLIETLPRLGLSFTKLADVVKFYEKHKSFIKALFSLLGAKQPTPTPGPTPDPTPVPIVSKLFGKILFIEEDRFGGPAGKFASMERFLQIVSEAGPDAQMMGERVHFDFTAFDAEGNEVPAEILRKIKRPNGAPALDLRWRRDGKMNWNSQDEPDHWGLESYQDRDNGFTPVLVLSEVSPGRHKCDLWAIFPAEYNNGLEVVSNEIVWYCD